MAVPAAASVPGRWSRRGVSSPLDGKHGGGPVIYRGRVCNAEETIGSGPQGWLGLSRMGWRPWEWPCGWLASC